MQTQDLNSLTFKNFIYQQPFTFMQKEQQKYLLLRRIVTDQRTNEQSWSPKQEWSNLLTTIHVNKNISSKFHWYLIYQIQWISKKPYFGTKSRVINNNSGFARSKTNHKTHHFYFLLFQNRHSTGGVEGLHVLWAPSKVQYQGRGGEHFKYHSSW